MPLFRPTQHLLDLNIGTKPWHSFAWACREIMSEYGRLPKGNGGPSEKRAFRQFMYNEIPECPPPFYGAEEDVKWSDGPPPAHILKWQEEMKKYTDKKKSK
jgi:hypothetical protein